jgi:competence protein ComEA
MFEEIDNKHKVIIVLLITNLLAIGYIFYQSQQKPTVESRESIGKDTIDASTTAIVVDISGEVLNPNYYIVDNGTRLYELIEIAGGVTPEANLSQVNLSSILQDEMKIYIPKIVVGEDGVVIEEPDYNSHLININTASYERLMELTGIGETKAKAIVEYRTTHGYFKSIEEIMNVKGIAEGTFNGIKDFICV